MRNLLLNSKKTGKDLRHSLRVDGPFCSPMEDLRKYRVLLCIAGGIGVTPFMSFLAAIRDGKKWTKKLHRICFVWVCRESDSFSWFYDKMMSCHMYCWQKNRPDLLDMRLYFTGQNNFQPDDFFKKRLYKGRPNWKDIFSEMKSIHPRFDIGVFSCGPQSLVNDVQQWCNQNNSWPARFYHYHETY